MLLLLALLGALAGGARAEMLHLNCTGLGFEAALQATVAQGLLNREAPRVYLSDIAEGLGDAGQQDGAGFPGAKFIEWKSGHGGGPWYQPATTCRTCGGLRERWLETAAAAAGETPRPITSTPNKAYAARSRASAVGIPTAFVSRTSVVPCHRPRY